MNTVRFSPARFPGPVVRTRATGDFVLTETRYAGDAALATHAHEYACLVIVLRGTFRELFGGKLREGTPGMVIVRPAGELHSDRFGRGGGSCLNVELTPQWLTRLGDASRALDAPAAFTGGAFPILGRRLHDELAHTDDVTPLAVESLVLAMIADAVREGRRTTSGPPRWLPEARAFIHDRLAERLTLEEIAGAAGVHPVHLAATFRRFFGHTVAAYIRQRRIEHACRMLTDSATPIAEIALAAGFADQSHFGRTFKQVMRVTPGEYRTAHWNAGVPAG